MRMTWFTSSYARCSAPVSTHVLEVLLWMWCSSYMDSFLFGTEGEEYSTFLNGLVTVLEQQQGMGDVENVHIFCQLLDRIMV